LSVLIENSSLSDFRATAGAPPLAAVTVTHPADKTIRTATIDLGGGSLGSRGRNRFVNNAGLDVAVTNANTATAPIRVDASGNYWGGGAPVMSSSTPADVSVSGNVMFNAPTHLTADPARWASATLSRNTPDSAILPSPRGVVHGNQLIDIFH
jgi:hypothetical protein